MTTYKIISDNTTLGKTGDSVSDADLDGLNVDALIQAGHIEQVVSAVRKLDKKDAD